MNDAPLVVVADDEPSLRIMVRRILEEAGYVVSDHPDGRAALEALEEDLSDRARMLLTDLVMPEMNGVELIDRVCERWPHVRVAWMSGYQPAELQKLGMTCPDEVKGVLKPFTAERLLALVRMVLSG